MTKRWNVHHGNDNLGLMTAKEIREALRKGTLDPFDKVSAEGSNIREDLIEVDEIFKETQEDAIEEFTSVQQIPPTANMVAGASKGRQQMPIQMAPAFSPSPPSSPAPRLKDPIPKGPDPSAPRTNSPPPAQPAMANPSWRTDPNQAFKEAAESKESKATQKRYYLIDKSKILGPLSGVEIQSLFNRGVLNKNVKVQKIGGTRSIPVAQFISTYSEDRLKELTDDGKLNQKVSSPSSKVLNELARVANAQKISETRKHKTYIIIAAVGILLGIFSFVVWDSSSSPSKRRESKEEREMNDASRRGNGRPKLLQKSQVEKEDVQDDEEEQSPPSRPTPRVSAQPPRPAARTQAPIAESPRERTRVAVKPTKKAPLTVPQAQSRPTSPKATPQRVAQKAAPTPAPKKVEKEKGGPIARALSSNRAGIQTIGPLSFSMGALDSCASKCTLVFKDSSGATLKAVFFKSAYYEQLKNSGGSVSLTGNTRKESGELTIFIQDVR